MAQNLIQREHVSVSEIIIFIMSIPLLFICYFSLIFPQVEKDLFRFYRYLQLQSTDGGIHIAIYYPTEISSFTSEIIWVFINRQNAPPKDDPEIRVFFPQGSLDSSGFNASLYICSNQTNLYQCPEAETFIALKKDEERALARMFFIYQALPNLTNIYNTDNRVWINIVTYQIDNQGKITEIMLKKVDNMNNNHATESNNNKKESIGFYLNIADNFVSKVRALIRAFIFFALLPPRSNYLLVTLAAIASFIAYRVECNNSSQTSKLKHETEFNYLEQIFKLKCLQYVCRHIPLFFHRFILALAIQAGALCFVLAVLNFVVLKWFSFILTILTLMTILFVIYCLWTQKKENITSYIMSIIGGE